jgi:hypothetical protein
MSSRIRDAELQVGLNVRAVPLQGPGNRVKLRPTRPSALKPNGNQLQISRTDSSGLSAFPARWLPSGQSPFDGRSAVTGLKISAGNGVQAGKTLTSPGAQEAPSPPYL